MEVYMAEEIIKYLYKECTKSTVKLPIIFVDQVVRYKTEGKS